LNTGLPYSASFSELAGTKESTLRIKRGLLLAASLENLYVSVFCV
jgi:hypothetical protein